MERNLNMVINHLPSLTWYRLGVNSARVEARVEAEGAATVNEQLAEGIAASDMNVSEARAWSEELAGEIVREKYIAAKTAIYQEQKFATGLGPDFDAYLDANTEKVRVYRVGAGKSAAPTLLHWNFGKGGADVSQQIIYAEEGSESTFILTADSDRDAEGMSAIGTKVFLEKGAKVHLIKINLLGKQFLQLDDTGAIAGEDSHFDFLQMELGANRTYVGCYVDQRGKHSNFTLNAGYMEGNEDLLDINYVTAQKGEKTNSKFEVKGVLSDRAYKVFRGTIDFRNGSAGSVGDEQEDVLLMDPEVVNKTIPIILCEEEDVDGRHGATIGRLSEDMLFYLQTRGISEKEAERMMVGCRLHSIERLVPDEQIRGQISAFIEEEFGGND